MKDIQRYIYINKNKSLLQKADTVFVTQEALVKPAFSKRDKNFDSQLQLHFHIHFFRNLNTYKPCQ